MSGQLGAGVPSKARSDNLLFSSKSNSNRNVKFRFGQNLSVSMNFQFAKFGSKNFQIQTRREFFPSIRITGHT